VWWGTPVECGSAIARRERDGKLTSTASNLAFEQLRALQSSWSEVTPSVKLRDIALRILRTHRLRAADSLQLAAAIVAADEQPATLGFVCLDERLTAAALREGFTVSP
jgi:predicted nucleic acid-binding protein